MNSYTAMVSRLYALSLGLVPVMAVLAPLGLTPLMLILGCSGIPLLISNSLYAAKLKGCLPTWLAIAMAWVLLSSLWSDFPASSLSGVTTLGITVFSALVAWCVFTELFNEDRLNTVRKSLFIGTLIAVCILLFIEFRLNILSYSSHALKSGLSSHSRGSILLSLMLLPTIFMLWHLQRKLAVTLTLLAVIAIWFSGSGSAKIALAVSLAAALGMWLFPRVLLWIALGLIGFCVFAMPVMTGYWHSPQDVADHLTFLQPSALHRAIIWQFVSDHIAMKPIVGWGFDASRWIPHADDDVLIQLHNPALPPAFLATMLPLHPHNAVLQWWLELGLVGAIILAGGLGVIFWRSFHAPDRRRALITVSLAASICAVSLVSFGAWQKWWVSAIWFLAIIGQAAAASVERGDSSPADASGLAGHQQ